MIASHIGSYVGENRRLEALVLKGELDLTLIPQGNAGGTEFARVVPVSRRSMCRQDWARWWPRAKRRARLATGLMCSSRALHADVSLIKAWKGDRLGNLMYRKTARNFNPAMATAAKLTIAEVEVLVEPGELDPDHIVTPGIYVNRSRGGRGLSKAD